MIHQKIAGKINSNCRPAQFARLLEGGNLHEIGKAIAEGRPVLQNGYPLEYKELDFGRPAEMYETVPDVTVDGEILTPREVRRDAQTFRALCWAGQYFGTDVYKFVEWQYGFPEQAKIISYDEWARG